MTIEYIKESKTRAGRVIPIGRQCQVTKEKGEGLIKKKIAKEIDSVTFEDIIKKKIEKVENDNIE